jgi:hypothetical protein
MNDRMFNNPLRVIIAIIIAITVLSQFAMPVQAADTYDDAVRAFITKDYAKAQKILKPLADQGNGKALYSLGLLYANGQGVKKNPVAAAALFSLAKKRGSKRAAAHYKGLVKQMKPDTVAQVESHVGVWKPGSLTDIQTLSSSSGQPKSEFAETVESIGWSWHKDVTAGNVITLVKDGISNVYQLLPAGPDLPFGASKEVIEAQKLRYGMRMVPYNTTGEKLIVSSFESTEQRVLRLRLAKKFASGMGQGWEVLKLGKDIYDGWTGEDSVKHAQNKIIAGTVAAEVGIALGHVTTALSLTPGVGIGVGLLNATAGEVVKTAMMDGLEAWDAQVEAIANERKWKQGELENTHKLVQRVIANLKSKNFEEAVKWNQRLYKFTVERQFNNADLSKLNTLSFDLQKKIYAIRAQARAAEKQDAQSYLAEIRRKEQMIRQESIREEKARLEKEAMFNVKLKASNTNLKPGEKVTVTITLNGGLPIFTISGDYQTQLKGRQDVFEFTAPSESGLYEIAVTVADKQGWKRQAKLDFLIENENDSKAVGEGHAETYSHEGSDPTNGLRDDLPEELNITDDVRADAWDGFWVFPNMANRRKLEIKNGVLEHKEQEQNDSYKRILTFKARIDPETETITGRFTDTNISKPGSGSNYASFRITNFTGKVSGSHMSGEYIQSNKYDSTWKTGARHDKKTYLPESWSAYRN